MHKTHRSQWWDWRGCRCAAARVWREKATAADPTREDGAPADLKALESLAAESTRIYVALPEAKVGAAHAFGRPSCVDA